MGFSNDAGGGGIPGNYVLRPQHRSEFEFHMVSQSGTELRLAPEISPDGVPMPLRTGRELDQIGNWITSEHFVIDYMGGVGGKPRITTLLTIAGDETKPREERRGLAVWETIRRVLYDRCAAGSAPSHWYQWVQDSRDAAFGTKSKSKAKIVTLGRGVLTGRITSQGVSRYVSRQKPKLHCVFGFKTNAQRALRDLVMEETPDAVNNHSDNWAAIFKNETKILDLSTGCLIQFTKPNTKYGMSGATGGAVAFSGANKLPESNFDDDEQFKIQATIADPAPLPLDIAKSIWRLSWGDLLNIYRDELALITALSTCLPDDLLVVAFMDLPEWLPDRLKRVRENMLSAGHGTPGFVAPGAGSTFAGSPGGVNFGGVATQQVYQQQQQQQQPQTSAPPALTTSEVDAVFFGVSEQPQRVGINPAAAPAAQTAAPSAVSAPAPQGTSSNPVGDGPSADLADLAAALRNVG